MSESAPSGTHDISISEDRMLTAALDTGDDAFFEQTEEQIVRRDLLRLAEADLAAAQNNLQATCDWLVRESIEDGDPARDISQHSEYTTALNERNRIAEIVRQLRNN